MVLRDARVLRPVVQAFEAEGLSFALRWDEVWGFRYAGEEYPARIRFYLDGGDAAKLNQVVVAYTHREARWGRDLGWTRLIRARLYDGPPLEKKPAPPTMTITPEDVINRADFPGGELDDLRFIARQLLLYHPEPGG